MRTKYPYEEFHARLLRDCNGFFTRYRGAGGDPDNVIVLLWYLTPESKQTLLPSFPALSYHFMRKLAALEADGAALLPYFPKTPTRLLRQLKQTVGELRGLAYQIRRSKAVRQAFIEAWNLPSRRGRPRGSSETVVLKVLELECRTRFHRPCYKQILELGDTAKGSPVVRTQKSENDPVAVLRIRLRAVPAAEAEPFHRRFFPATP